MGEKLPWEKHIKLSWFFQRQRINNYPWREFRGSTSGRWCSPRPRGRPRAGSSWTRVARGRCSWIGRGVLAGADEGGPSFLEGRVHLGGLGNFLLGGGLLGAGLVWLLLKFYNMFLELGFEDGALGYLGSSEIYNLQVPTFVKHEVFWLPKSITTFRSLWVTPTECRY